MFADADPRGTIVPTLRYRDVPAAMDWLCKAFGFAPHLTVTGDDGTVRYAELTYGDGMVMLGPVEEAPGSASAEPGETGGAETQLCYLFVADARAHCARAEAAGAEITLGIDDEASGGRGYTCRDPEGHVWSFGTYDPWQRSARQGAERRFAGRVFGTPGRLAFLAGVMAVTVASAALAGWALGITPPQFGLERGASPELTANAHLEHALEEAKQGLAAERRAREAAERAAREMAAQLAQERNAREAAVRAAATDNGRALDEAREQLAREKTALEALRRAAQETRERLALAERSAAAVREQLAAERSARAAAEQASLELKEQLERQRQAQDARDREIKEAAQRAALQERARQVKAVAVKRTYYRYRVVPLMSGTRWRVNWDEIVH